MPYKMFKQGEKFCVKNSDTGESKGCSDSRAKAVGHMRALYAAEGGAKMGKKEIEDLDALITKEITEFNTQYPPTEDEVKELEELKTKHYGYYEYYVPWGITSFADLDSWRAAQETAHEVRMDSDAFISMVDNILTNTEIPNKMKAVKALADEYDTRTISSLSGSGEYKKETDNQDDEGDEEKAISKREDVSEADKKRAVGEYGKVTYADPKNKKYPVDTAEHIRAAWSYIGMPKNQAKYSSSEVAAIKRRIVSAWKSKIGKDGPPSAKKEIEYLVDIVMSKVKEVLGEEDDIPVATPEEDDENVFTWYDKETGKWRWLARYSNNFLDRDNPPEIISSDSHRRFVELVDKGLAPLPDAWLWHIKSWKLGTATWIAYDDSGFSLAAGDYDEGNEQVAEWLK